MSSIFEICTINQLSNSIKIEKGVSLKYLSSSKLKSIAKCYLIEEKKSSLSLEIYI